jgi:phenylalanyl-tRNA synthetase alpha chain
LIRGVAGDIVEKVVLFDQFTNQKTGRRSQAYRIEYRNMERTMTNAEVDALQATVRERLSADLGVELR